MRFIFIMCWLLLGSISVQAQLDTLKMYHISSDEGLPSDNIEYVYQDSYGFMWMANFEGLIRWDGHTFRKYQHSNKDSTSLSHNIVYCITEDSQRRLWIGTIGGLNLYDRKKDSFSPCPLNWLEQNVPINMIKEDSKHRLWLGTSYGLCQYDAETGKTKWYTHDNKNAHSLKNDVIFGLTIDRQDNVWAATFNAGVFRFTPSTEKFTYFKHQVGNAQTICSNKTKSIYVDTADRIWVGSVNKGITLLDADGKIIRHYPRFSNKENENGSNIITSIYEDKNQHLWVGMENQPAYYLDRKTDTFEPFENPAYKKPQARCQTVISFGEDTFGNLWFATRSEGLFYTNSRKNVFRYYYQKEGTKGLKNNTVTALHEDEAGRFWVGTYGGGLAQLDAKQNTFTHITTANGLSSNIITDITDDHQGNLWVATWSGGLVHFNPLTRQSKMYVNDPNQLNSLPYNNIKSILTDDTLLWIGTHGEGLAVLNLKNNQFIHQRNNTHFPFDMSQPAWINHLFKDTKGQIWVSTYGGLYVYDRKSLLTYKHGNSPNTLSSSDINMVTQDAKGQIWVISESGGLDLFDEKKGAFIRYSEQYELPQTFKSITTDAKGILWLSSNEGLTAFDPVSKKQTRYDASNGLQGNFFYHKAVLRTRSGELAFGGTNGFNVFHPDKLRNNGFTSPIYLTDLFIFDQVQRPAQEQSPLKEVLAFTDTLVLGPHQSFFTLGFTALDLYSPRKIRYSYQLEGLHNQWINSGLEGKAAFTNLAPGTYQFRVRYTSGDGVWHEKLNKLTIILLPPWWKTWWFRVALALLTLTLIVAAFYLRLASIRQRNKELETEVAKRTHELTETNTALLESNEEVTMQNERLEEYNEEIRRKTDKILQQQEQIVVQNLNLGQHVKELAELNYTKDRFFSILAHDLKNPVQALLGHASFLKNSLSTLAKSDLSDISGHIFRSTVSVYDLLTNLLDWALTQSDRHSMVPKALSLRAIIERNTMLSEAQCRQKVIAVEVSVDPAHCVLADSYMVDTIVRNLLSNSIKFTPSNGKIILHSEETEDRIMLSIQDTGVGMTPEQISNLFKIDRKHVSKGTEGEPGTGLGFIIIREFLELNRGSIRIESEAGKGSRFLISLPIAYDTSTLASDFKDSPKTYPIELSYPTPKAPTGLIEDFTDLLVDQPIMPEEIITLIKGKRILIVDDNVELRAYLRLLLSGTLEIFEAENGQQGLEKAAECQPAIILSDMLMPIMDGATFCKNLKQDPTTSHIPVILLTSQGNEESQLSGYDAGADAYLLKPLRQDILFRVIHNFIRNQEKLRKRMRQTNEIYLDDLSINKLDVEFLNKVTSYIEANMSEQNMDTEALIELTAMSRTVLYAKLKAVTGLGVHEFIKTIRLKTSIQFLVEGRLSVSQIAYQVGFTSPSHYVRSFTKQYGLPPKEYMKKLREGKIDK